MGSRSGSWKIVIGLAVACGVLVFLGGFLHRRSLEDSVLKSQDASKAYVATKLTHAVDGLDLSQPVKDAAAASLTKDLDLPSGDELRIFSVTGSPVYTSPGLEAFAADTEALSTALTGGDSKVIDKADLRVYAPIEGKAHRVMGVAAVVTSYTALRNDASGPLDALRLPLVIVGVLLLIAGLYLMLRATKGAAPVSAAPAAEPVAPAAPPKSRVTGFEPAPALEPSIVAQQTSAAAADAAPKQRFGGLRLGGKHRATDGAPPAVTAESVEPTEKKSMFARRSGSKPVAVVAEAPAPAAEGTSALDREVAIRQALEDQLEQLRTQVKTQEDERLNAVRQLQAQLEEATHRAETAEALVPGSGSAAIGSVASSVAPEQIASLEQELARAKAAAADAIARADEVQRAAAASPPTPTPDPALEQRVAEMAAQLEDAQQRAASAEQRAASVESVRDELEVRVAQLGAATGEVEQRAAELEAKLQDANAGGDAVRAETAALTAALAAANARTQELESAPADMGDRDADQAEISRLRGELAKHMERAQVAEDRISTLEADVLAAARGVQALEAHAATPAAKAPKPSGIEERAEPEPESAPTRDHQPEPARDVSSEPASAAVPPAPSSAARYDDMWTPAPAAPAEANAEPVEASTVGAAPRGPAEQPTSTASEATTSSDAGHDETAEPEDELSPDDMWSLRARLADAAARKRRHIE